MSHTLEQIQAALDRGAEVRDENKNLIISLDNQGRYLDRWMTLHYCWYDFTGWRIEEKPDSPQPRNPFEADGFHVECPNTNYVNGVAEELDQFMTEVPENCEIVHQNVSSVTCTSTPAQSWDDFPSYDFTDRAKWLAHAQAIKERERKAKEWPQVGDTVFIVSMTGERAYVDTYVFDGSNEDYQSISSKNAFKTKPEAQALASKINAVLDGAKVVKYAEDLDRIIGHDVSWDVFSDFINQEDGARLNFSQEIFKHL